MAEDEAKTKWCPFARVMLRTGYGAGNRYHGGDWGESTASRGALDRKAMCVGSACMAWRVLVTPAHQENVYQTERPDGEGWKPFTPHKANGGWWRQIPETSTSYCGLAGQP